MNMLRSNEGGKNVTQTMGLRNAIQIITGRTQDHCRFSLNFPEKLLFIRARILEFMDRPVFWHGHPPELPDPRFPSTQYAG
jgi:hypothetical protein